MKRKYTFHPEEYAVGENEKYYAEMAARGWVLEKRGTYLSRFRRAEPQKLVYRIELSSPAPFDDPTAGLPDEQIALYEDCGWRYVTSAGLVNVFCAPESSGAPEFYTDPRQQAATLKALRRSYRLGWLPVAVVLGVNFLMAAAMRGSAGKVLDSWANGFELGFVRYTAFWLAWGILLLKGIYQLTYGAVRTMLLYRRLKNGRPIDHAPRRRPAAHKLVSYTLNGLLGLFLLLCIIQFFATQKYDMPQQADGPYLLLRDLGWDGERTTNYLETPSNVQTSRSLAARQWDTYECVAQKTEFAGSVWMYQDVYELHTHEQAMAAARILMSNATFARGPEDFTAGEVAGLDAAWRAGMECIAVHGRTVWKITYSDPGLSHEPGVPAVDVLEVLAQQLKGWES